MRSATSANSVTRIGAAHLYRGTYLRVTDPASVIRLHRECPSWNRSETKNRMNNHSTGTWRDRRRAAAAAHAAAEAVYTELLAHAPTCLGWATTAKPQLIRRRSRRSYLLVLRFACPEELAASACSLDQQFVSKQASASAQTPCSVSC